MADRKAKKAIGGETKVMVAAARFVSDSHAGLEQAAAAPDVLGEPESLHTLAVAATDMREALRLFAPLYLPADRRRWAQRVRDLSRDLKPVRQFDVLSAELRAVARTAGIGGQRAIAFLIGHGLALRDRDAAVAAARLERLDLSGRKAAFERFAGKPKSATERKTDLRTYAAGALSARVDAVAAALASCNADCEPATWRALHVASRRAIVAADAFAPCYETAAFEAARGALARIHDETARLLVVDAALDAVGDPAMTMRSRAAGVTRQNLVDLASALRRRRERALLEVGKRVTSIPGRQLKSLVLAPVIPGFVESDREEVPPSNTTPPPPVEDLPARPAPAKAPARSRARTAPSRKAAPRKAPAKPDAAGEA